MTRHEAFAIAGRIAFGHAFDKHVTQLKEFPEISAPGEFQEIILEVLLHPDQEKLLERSRRAYWSDKHLTIVIVDADSDSNGTAFRPKSGKEYFAFGLQ